MNLQEILKQAERGVHQAPTLEGYRHPKIKGWKELATTSPDKISQMAANGYSGYNWVSVAKDGFACIIDIDDVEYAKSIGMPIPLDTFIVNTPSGGLHVYLWHTNESVELGNTNILGPDGSPAIEFKANNLTCASPGVLRSDKEPHGYYAPANANEIQPIRKELVEFLRTHGRQKKQYAASAAKREFHPGYELEDEIEHQGWAMTGREKVGSEGVRYIEFAVCPIEEEVHQGMDEPGNFKCCLTIGDYGIGFDCKAGRHEHLTISDVWDACEVRGIAPYPYCRYLDEDKTLEAKTLADAFGAENATSAEGLSLKSAEALPESIRTAFKSHPESLSTAGKTISSAHHSDAPEAHSCLQCGEPLSERWRIVCDECSENAKSDDAVCYEVGCNCKKRHPRLEEGDAFIKEYEERKAEVADLKTMKVIDPVEGGDGELVLASGETEKQTVVSLSGILASDVETTELKWLWHDRIPAGKPSLFTGKSDNGKSMCLLDVIARTTTGQAWPDGSKNTLGARRVLLATSEDDPSDTLVPRLQAAGADLSKVVLITVSKQIKGQPKSKRMLKLKEDAKLLEKALVANPDVALVALDPMSSFFGTEGGLNKDESVRPIMDSLANTLRKTGATLIGIVHTNKRSDVDALEKVLGAGSLVQSSRSVWGFSRDPESDNEFYMALLKNNLTKKRGGMKYRISEKKIKLTSGVEVLAPYVEWTGEHDHSANDLMDKERKLRKEGGKDGSAAEASQRELAKKFLLDNLRRGTDKIGELLDLAVEGGISKATFWRAAKELNLQSTAIKPKRFLLPLDSKVESPMQDVDEL